MSAAAIPIYNALIEQGMPPAQAQRAAEAAAEAQRKAMDEVQRVAAEQAGQKIAESEKTLRGEVAASAERAAAQTEQVRRESVPRDEFHRQISQLPPREEIRAEFAATRKELREELHMVRDDLKAGFHADLDQLRADNRALHVRIDRLQYLLIGLLVVVGGSALTVAGVAIRFILGL